MFDTHCHLTSKEFAGCVAEILDEAGKAGVRGVITVATTSADSLQALALAKAHANVWCSAGLHPLYADEPIDWETIKGVAADPKCIAWGELGLDNHYDRPPRAMQDRVLSEQLAFVQGIEASRHRGIKASPLDASMPGCLDASVPIIVHCRDAFDDLLAVFRSAPFDPSRYVFHCFTGNANDARKVLDFGAWISFTGVVTFQNAAHVAEAAKLVPADRIMVETDAPYLTPEPMRKVRPNEPKFVVHIARKLAELRRVDPAEFEQQLDDNVRRFFRVDF